MVKLSNPLFNVHKDKPKDCLAGVVGLGLMGTSITACLLVAGHRVVGVENEANRRRIVKRSVLKLLRELWHEKFLKADPESLIENLTVASACSALTETTIVVEAITESLRKKELALHEVEKHVSPDTLIATNTSAIPITQIQQRMDFPQRLLGMHWDEPAHVTTFMEIIKGKKTTSAYFDLAVELAREWWGKDPSRVRKDIRGFITNRISYAMFREACYLVDSGVASVEDVDRSLRNDVGWWISFAGPFRYMDLMGVTAYATVMRDLLPDLSCNSKIPRVMKRAVKDGGRGISNGKGFYEYTPDQAKQWKNQFLKFNYEMRRLAVKCPVIEE